MGRKTTIIGAESVEGPQVAEEQPEDIPMVSLRPRSLEEYGRAGQRVVVENLGIAIEAAHKRSEPLEHVLLYGPPGLGKTTLAHVIANEMNATLISSSGPALERQSDLMGILTNLDSGNILFVDEIHRLPRTVEEFLYSAMEDFSVDFVLEKGAHARTIKFPLKRFTLVGATTRSGMLTPPLRDRFGFHYHLDFYSPKSWRRLSSGPPPFLKLKSSPMPPLRSRTVLGERRASPTGFCVASATLPRCAATAASPSTLLNNLLSERVSTTVASTTWTDVTSKRSKTFMMVAPWALRPWRPPSMRRKTPWSMSSNPSC